MSKFTPEQTEIMTRFDFHSPSKITVKTMEDLRENLKRHAVNLTVLVPDCRERATAITKLEEAMFWTNAALARKGACE